MVINFIVMKMWNQLYFYFYGLCLWVGPNSIISSKHIFLNDSDLFVILSHTIFIWNFKKLYISWLVIYGVFVNSFCCCVGKSTKDCLHEIFLLLEII